MGKLSLLSQFHIVPFYSQRVLQMGLARQEPLASIITIHIGGCDSYTEGSIKFL